MTRDTWEQLDSTLHRKLERLQAESDAAVKIVEANDKKMTELQAFREEIHTWAWDLEEE